MSNELERHDHIAAPERAMPTMRQWNKEAESQLVKQLLYSGIVKVLGFTRRLLAIQYPTALQERWLPVCVHTKDVP